jgi:putative ABC transport system ATP-binding protein
MPVLRVVQLEIERGSAQAPFKVGLPQLTLQASQAMAVTGPSGCGKSTLIEALGLILQPSRVEHFELAGHDLTERLGRSLQQSDPVLSDLRRLHYGFVPQSHGLLPYLSVNQNIALQARLLGRTIDAHWLDPVQARLGLAGLGDRLPRELSVGQRQRVSFLRAIAHQPDLLLADEPTAALDPSAAAKLFEVMLDISLAMKTACLIVTHEWDLVKGLSLPCLEAQAVSDQHMAFVA